MVPRRWTGGKVGFVLGDTTFLSLFSGLMDRLCFSDEIVSLLG
jgi:hypothetical protein